MLTNNCQQAEGATASQLSLTFLPLLKTCMWFKAPSTLCFIVHKIVKHHFFKRNPDQIQGQCGNRLVLNAIFL